MQSTSARAITLPPLEEQEGIVSDVKAMVRPIELGIKEQQRVLNLVREYRTRLVTDVVTGKLDVRIAAANLPSEPREPEALDNGDALGEAEDLAEAELGRMHEEVYG